MGRSRKPEEEEAAEESRSRLDGQTLEFFDPTKLKKKQVPLLNFNMATLCGEKLVNVLRKEGNMLRNVKALVALWTVGTWDFESQLLVSILELFINFSKMFF